MWIFKVGVVGAGAMGGGIGQVVTFSGLPVVVKDIDQGQIEAARKHVEGIYQSRVDKGKMTPAQMQEKLDLIEYTLDYGDFADVDIVIEAVPEVMGIKQAVLKELDEVCPPDTIFASNTSALSITEMGSVTNRPNRIIGMHFFSPAHVMKLVEVIATPETGVDSVAVSWACSTNTSRSASRAPSAYGARASATSRVDPPRETASATRRSCRVNRRSLQSRGERSWRESLGQDA